MANSPHLHWFLAYQFNCGRSCEQALDFWQYEENWRKERKKQKKEMKDSQKPRGQKESTSTSESSSRPPTSEHRTPSAHDEYTEESSGAESSVGTQESVPPEEIVLPQNGNPADELHDSETEEDNQDEFRGELNEELTIGKIRRIFEGFAKKEFDGMTEEANGLDDEKQIKKGYRIKKGYQILRILYLRQISNKCRQWAENFRLCIRKLSFVLGRFNNHIKIEIHFKFGEWKTVEYWDGGQGQTLIISKNPKGYIHQKRFQTSAVLDFCFLLRKRANDLQELEFEVDPEVLEHNIRWIPDISIYSKLSRVLRKLVEVKDPATGKVDKKRKNWIPVTRFSFRVVTVPAVAQFVPCQVTAVLQHLKPVFLKCLEFTVWQTRRALPNLEILPNFAVTDTIADLKQWKSARSLMVVDSFITHEWIHYTKFKRITIHLLRSGPNHINITRAFAIEPSPKKCDLFVSESMSEIVSALDQWQLHDLRRNEQGVHYFPTNDGRFVHVIVFERRVSLRTHKTAEWTPYWNYRYELPVVDG